jgi:hypothetical protein
MASSPDRRYFTVEEARRLVPHLRTLLRRMQSDQKALREAMKTLSDLTDEMRGNGHAPTAQRYEAAVLDHSERLRNTMVEISDLGVEIKDIDTGLVDFPSLRDGREVYLCWRVDEETIGYWHDIDTGFNGRRPLDE